MTGSREYDNRRRTQAAAATRQQILDAAGQCFGESGYGSTTLGAVAKRADVSVETIKKTFKTKSGLLLRWFEACVAGPEAVPVAEAGWLDELSGIASFGERVDLLAAWLTAVFERAAVAVSVMTAAAHTDPDIASMWAEERVRRFADVAAITPLVLGDEVPAMPLEALVDALYALSEVHVYLVLVEERHWTPQQYRDWFARSVKQLVAGQPTANPQDT